MAPRTRTEASRRPQPPQGERLVESLLAAWRPLLRLDVDGFAVLRSRGITRRANSAVALDAPEDPAHLAAAVGRVEQLMRGAGGPVLFRVLPEHGPAALDGILESIGYTVGPICNLLAASTAGRSADPSVRIDVGPLPADWFAASWALAPRDGTEAEGTLHDILAGTPALYASLSADDGSVIAVGRAAIITQGRTSLVVVNAMSVAPSHRRQGLGRRVLEALLSAAAAHGAHLALLEVEIDNPAALRLYAGAGFTGFSTYHYRVAPEETAR